MSCKTVASACDQTCSYRGHVTLEDMHYLCVSDLLLYSLVSFFLSEVGGLVSLASPNQEGSTFSCDPGTCITKCWNNSCTFAAQICRDSSDSDLDICEVSMYNPLLSCYALAKRSACIGRGITHSGVCRGLIKNLWSGLKQDKKGTTLHNVGQNYQGTRVMDRFGKDFVCIG
jgi:hypothetical protein